MENETKIQCFTVFKERYGNYQSFKLTWNYLENEITGQNHSKTANIQSKLQLDFIFIDALYNCPHFHSDRMKSYAMSFNFLAAPFNSENIFITQLFNEKFPFYLKTHKLRWMCDLQQCSFFISFDYVIGSRWYWCVNEPMMNFGCVLAKTSDPYSLSQISVRCVRSAHTEDVNLFWENSP